MVIVSAIVTVYENGQKDWTMNSGPISNSIWWCVVGGLYDYTGSYSISFWTSGALIAIAGIICLPIQVIAKWEKRRSDDDADVMNVNLPEVRTSRSGSQYSRLSTHDDVHA